MFALSPSGSRVSPSRVDPRRRSTGRPGQRPDRTQRIDGPATDPPAATWWCPRSGSLDPPRPTRGASHPVKSPGTRSCRGVPAASGRDRRRSDSKDGSSRKCHPQPVVAAAGSRRWPAPAPAPGSARVRTSAPDSKGRPPTGPGSAPLAVHPPSRRLGWHWLAMNPPRSPLPSEGPTESVRPGSTVPGRPPRHSTPLTGHGAPPPTKLEGNVRLQPRNGTPRRRHPPLPPRGCPVKKPPPIHTGRGAATTRRVGWRFPRRADPC